MAISNDDSRYISLHDYVDELGRRRWMVAGIILASAAFGLVGSLVMTDPDRVEYLTHIEIGETPKIITLDKLTGGKSDKGKHVIFMQMIERTKEVADRMKMIDLPMAAQKTGYRGDIVVIWQHNSPDFLVSTVDSQANASKAQSLHQNLFDRLSRRHEEKLIVNELAVLLALSRAEKRKERFQNIESTLQSWLGDNEKKWREKGIDPKIVSEYFETTKDLVKNVIEPVLAGNFDIYGLSAEYWTKEAIRPTRLVSLALPSPQPNPVAPQMAMIIYGVVGVSISLVTVFVLALYGKPVK